MKRPIVTAIAAIGTRTRALGKDNDLVWDLPNDLARFKKITNGHPIIMGRKTYESIGKALPNRTNIVVTRNKDYEAGGCIVVHSLEEALEKACEVENNELFLIGGSYIFKEGLSHTDRLYLTLVDDNSPADVFFPEYEDTFTKEVSREEGEENDLRYTYVTLERA